MLQITNHKLVNVAYSDLDRNDGNLTPNYIAVHYTAGISVSGSISHLKKLSLAIMLS